MRIDIARHLRRALAALGLVTAWAALATMPAQAATITVINLDEPGVGFNDPTRVAPEGGNAATTLGAQRLAVFREGARIWGAKLASAVPIQLLASFAPLACDSNSAVLGSAGAYTIYTQFPNAPRARTWYPAALANKLAGLQLSSSSDPMVNADIFAMFNGNLGQPGCLDGSRFYLGLDGRTPAGQYDLLKVLLHELGHGLGFQTYTSTIDGTQVQLDGVGLPSAWDHLLFDRRLGRTWAAMSDAQRQQSAVTPQGLVWNGVNVSTAVPKVLQMGKPDLFIANGGFNRFLDITTAAYGPQILPGPFTTVPTGNVLRQAGSPGIACTTLDAANTAAVRNRIAIIDRGGCDDDLKTYNAQRAGAKGVILSNNVSLLPEEMVFGSVWPINIPTVQVGSRDGALLKLSTSANRLRATMAPVAVLLFNPAYPIGTDRSQRPFLYTPASLATGSSVSHFDVSATPNLLMEPFINADLGLTVSAPKDLTLELLRDLGW